MEVEFPDVPEYSSEVLEGVLNERLIDYSKLRTLNDAKLCQLSWVYDMNFPATLRRLKEQDFLEKLLALLPQDVSIGRLRHKLLEYVDRRFA